IFKINEGIDAGYLLTTALGVNPEIGETLTYSITGGNTGGMFSIDPVTGAITTNFELDYETTPTYNLVIRVTDDGPGNAYTEKTLFITLQDRVEPVLTTNTGMTVLEGATTTITS